MAKSELHDAYSKNARFREYVDKYCRKYPEKITVSEALTHDLVRLVYLDFKEDDRLASQEGEGLYEKPTYVPRELCFLDEHGKVNDMESCKDYCKRIKTECDECVIQKCFDQLAAYQDIGLTPEQILEVDRLYAEKCKEVAELKKSVFTAMEMRNRK
ncbi:MAG: hypothetical protein NC434_10955 [Ruminococcus sp.]|nr:hypothetical protein [Ruminococcus sp.]